MLHLGDDNLLDAISSDQGQLHRIRLVLEIRLHVKAKASSSRKKKEIINCLFFSLLVIDMTRLNMKKYTFKLSITFFIVYLCSVSA